MSMRENIFYREEKRKQHRINHKDNEDTIGKNIVSVRQEEILRTIQEPNKVSG